MRKLGIFVIAFLMSGIFSLGSVHAGNSPEVKEEVQNEKVEQNFTKQDIEKAIISAERKAWKITSAQYLVGTKEFEKIYEDLLESYLSSDIVLLNYEVSLKKNIENFTDKFSNTTMSESSAPKSRIDIRDPSVYYSSQGIIVTGAAYWINNSWDIHDPFWGTEVGGADGLGIYFNDSTNLRVASNSFYTYDNLDNSFNNNLSAIHKSGNGVYYKAQDEHIWREGGWVETYTWDSSHITVWPSFKGPVDTYVYTQWTHTWESSGVESVSIGTGGFDVNVSNETYTWKGTNPGYGWLSN